VKPSTAHCPKQHLIVKDRKGEKKEGEGAPAPETPSLANSHYGNTTELGAAGQFVTSLDSPGSVRLRTGILRV